MQKTITKWQKNLLNPCPSDKELLGWSFEERAEFSKIIQSHVFLGEGKPSN